VATVKLVAHPGHNFKAETNEYHTDGTIYFQRLDITELIRMDGNLQKMLLYTPHSESRLQCASRISLGTLRGRQLVKEFGTLLDSCVNVTLVSECMTLVIRFTNDMHRSGSDSLTINAEIRPGLRKWEVVATGNAMGFDENYLHWGGSPSSAAEKHQQDMARRMAEQSMAPLGGLSGIDPYPNGADSTMGGAAYISKPKAKEEDSDVLKLTIPKPIEVDLRKIND
jgi:hypothetical protein